MTVAVWDVYAAEYADTRRGGKDARIKQPCVFCGRPTKALSRVCLDHDDLPALEDAPANPRPCRSDRETMTAPVVSLVGASSSATGHVLPGTDGDSGTVALDLSETA